MQLRLGLVPLILKPLPGVVDTLLGLLAKFPPFFSRNAGRTQGTVQWLIVHTVTVGIVFVPSPDLVLPPVVVGLVLVCLVGSSRPVVSVAEQIFGEIFAILPVGVVAPRAVDTVVVVRVGFLCEFVA